MATLTTGHDQRHEFPPPAPIPFDRRRSERRPAIGTLEAVRCDGMALPIARRFALLDESDNGLAIKSDVPIPPGALLRVRTCPIRDVWRDFVVVRCAPIGRGYRVGLAMQLRRAA